mmetsp:Transcript_30051/g.80707  ORF Transcript_30051/g.80707 Transcript_30051/m.80707 type:complete len:276 (-) Transcript_30051:698-1525(-)
MCILAIARRRSYLSCARLDPGTGGLLTASPSASSSACGVCTAPEADALVVTTLPSGDASELQSFPRIFPKRSRLEEGFVAGRSPGTMVSKTLSAPFAKAAQPDLTTPANPLPLLLLLAALGTPGTLSTLPDCISASWLAVLPASSLADSDADSAAVSRSLRAVSMEVESSSTVAFASDLRDVAAASSISRFLSNVDSSLGLLSSSAEVCRAVLMALRTAARLSSTREEKSATVEPARVLAALAASSAACSSERMVALREPAAAWSGRSKRARRSA